MGCIGTGPVHYLDRTHQLDFRHHNLPADVVRLQMPVSGDAGALPVGMVHRRAAVANADRTYDYARARSPFSKAVLHGPSWP